MNLRKVRIIPEKLSERGILPPNLPEALKTGEFEIIGRDEGQKPAVLLSMPDGIGVQQKVKGLPPCSCGDKPTCCKFAWSWWVFATDVQPA